MPHWAIHSMNRVSYHKDGNRQTDDINMNLTRMILRIINEMYFSIFVI